MNTEQIEADLINIFAEKLCREKSTIGADATIESLNADSLDLVEIVMEIEEKFNIKVPDEKSNEIGKGTIRDIVKFITEERLKQATQ